jgi:Chitobiase/beta-hexosaminidase C-terminal domain
VKSSIVLASLLALSLSCSDPVTIHLPARDDQSESLSSGHNSSESMTPVDGCWQLPVVDRVRLFPMPGQADALAGGKIVGSVASATNNFVDLATITEAPADGAWLDLTFDNDQVFRFVKYYGPPGSHGVVAEVELYAGSDLLGGKGFGSAGEGGSLENGFAFALDGDETTWFEGPLPSDNYVGLDLGAEHVVAAPTFTPRGGVVPVGTTVTLEAESGTTLSYTTDGTDPREDGTPYTGPIDMPSGTTLLKAFASRDCALDSGLTQAAFSVVANAGDGAPSVQSSTQASMHIGNSLTDTIVDHMETLAAAGGIALDFNRYTIPGAGTWLYETNPTGGYGVANVKESLLTRPFDHVSMQPFPNGPCQPLPSTAGPEFGPDSDSGYLNEAWADARTQNPNVQFWVYQQWPDPVDYVDCHTGGGWTRGDWLPPAPQSWEDAVATGLIYQEIVRGELARLNPDAPAPYIIPGGLALVALKHAIEAGQVPGINDFFPRIFQDAGANIHMTPAGAYFITLVFYACMFEKSPEGLINDSNGELNEEQAAIFQRLAWETVSGYGFSGVTR